MALMGFRIISLSPSRASPNDPGEIRHIQRCSGQATKRPFVTQMNITNMVFFHIDVFHVTVKKQRVVLEWLLLYLP